MQNLSILKSRLSKSTIMAGRSDSLQTIKDNLPVTFFVLQGEWSKKFGWLHPVGVHFVDGKQIPCREVAEAGTCAVCERIRKMERDRVPESQIFPIRGPEKFAMNVLVKGELSPRIFLAVASVAGEILRTWETIQNASNVNIFEPMASFAWTLIRSKTNGRTSYQVSVDTDAMPIVTGDNAEERIAQILESAANLDERFRLPI